MKEFAPDAAVPPLELEQISCPVCGAEGGRLVRRGGDLTYGCPGEFQLLRCPGCGHVYVNPRPLPFCIGQFYPPDYAPHHHAPFETPAGTESAARSLRRRLRDNPWIRRLYEWIVDPRGHVMPDAVSSEAPRGLELGCADGVFLEEMRRRGWQMTGVETSPDAAAVAIRKGFDVRIGTLDAANLPDAHFDAVLAWMVLEHVHDPLGTLREIWRVLKPGGTLAFSVPNFGCWEAWAFGRYWWALDLPRHLHHFRPRILRRILREANFERIEIIHQRNLNNVVGSIGLWLGVKFPRKRWRDRLIAFIDNPRAGGILALAPGAWFLAAIRQGGRLTVVARKPAGDCGQLSGAP